MPSTKSPRTRRAPKPRENPMPQAAPRMTVYWVSHYANGFRIYTRHYSQCSVELRLRELHRCRADLDTVRIQMRRIEEGEDLPWKA